MPACQSYAPEPLDAEAQRRAWHARLAEAPALQRAIDEMEASARPPAVSADALADFDAADGLTVDEARLVAAVFHPDLRVARLKLARARAGSEHAGRWADPALSLDVLRITESVPDPWIVGTGLAFSVPLTGRLAAEHDLAAARLDVATQVVREKEWELDLAVLHAWVDWTAARKRAEEAERHLEALDDVAPMALDLAEAGELPRTEAAPFAIERARARGRVERLRGEAQAAEQILRARLGLRPEAPVHFLPTFEVAPAVGGEADGPAEDHPTLARLRGEYAVAEQRLRSAVAGQWPDLRLGPQYESDEGQSRVGLHGTLPLPLWNGNRRAIAEARAGRDLARAAFDSSWQGLVARWAEARRRANGLAAQRRILASDVAPAATRQLDAVLELLRLGEGSSLLLLEALRRAHDARMELIDVRAAEARARATLAHLAGPVPEDQP